MHRDKERTLLLCCLIACASACVRQHERLVANEAEIRQPTFLASGSGVYAVARIRTAIGAFSDAELVGALFNAVEIGDTLVLASASRSSAFGDNGIFSFVIPLDRSGAHPTGSVELTDMSEGVAVTLRFIVRMGFDSMSLGVVYPDDESAPDFCRGEAAGSECLVLELERLCDFDARLSGIYTATVEAETISGACTDAPPHEVAVVAGNGIGDALIVGIGQDGVAFGAIGEFSAFDSALTMSRPVAKAAFDMDPASFAGGIGFSGDTVHFSGEFQAASPACVQRLRVSADRLSGAQPGISCPQARSLCNPLADAVCPSLPGDAFGGRLSFAFSPGDGACPTASCTLELDPWSVCPRARFAIFEPCPKGQRRTLVATDACNDIVCQASGACDDDGEGRFAADLAYCGQGSVFSFTGDSQCLSMDCTSAAASCEVPLDCSALFGVSTVFEDDPTSECRLASCRFPWNWTPADHAVGANGAPLGAAQAQAAFAAPYRLSGVNNAAVLSQGAPSGEDVALVVLNDEQARCQPIDLRLQTLACPMLQNAYVPAGVDPGTGGYQPIDVEVRLTRRFGTDCFQLGLARSPATSLSVACTAPALPYCVSVNPAGEPQLSCAEFVRLGGAVSNPCSKPIHMELTLTHTPLSRTLSLDVAAGATLSFTSALDAHVDAASIDVYATYTDAQGAFVDAANTTLSVASFPIMLSPASCPP